jgi:hypothetical protein
MIKSYNSTWHFYQRILQLTSRRADYQPLYIVDSLFQFLNSIETPILDIGCGENNLKLYYPTKITGIDKTLESDVFGFIGDDAWDKLPAYNNGIAINSLHWGDIENNITTALKKCSRMFITLNENQNIDKWKTVDAWKELGNVEYFWHGQNPDTKQEIYEFLQNDHLYNYLHPDKLEYHAERVFLESVMKDPFYGVVRVIITA